MPEEMPKALGENGGTSMRVSAETPISQKRKKKKGRVTREYTGTRRGNIRELPYAALSSNLGFKVGHMSRLQPRHLILPRRLCRPASAGPITVSMGSWMEEHRATKLASGRKQYT
eukprot:scaffold120943_cov17-Tisochrysis_lutea.AAC.1